jgi:CRISPR-associated protein Cas1
MPINLHELPQFSDRISWVYAEYGEIEKDDNGLVFQDKTGSTPLPVAAVSMLMLGPGTTITHRAAIAAAQMNCLISWVGEGVTRTYASSTGGASQTHNLLKQARLWADPQAHLAVVRKMYAMRFEEPLDPGDTLQQIRGREGARVRSAYLRIAQEVGIRWSARRYEPGNWSAADLPNRCLSAANAALYGVVHAALISAGYSPALGFIHTGKPLSFVYDIADLYKLDLAVRIAFEVAAQKPEHPEREVRKRCREAFYSTHLMARVLPDVAAALDAGSAVLSKSEIEEMFYVGDDGDGLPALAAG